MTAPSPDGEGAARSMKMAMKDAGLSPAEVTYLNAHGTSTPLNDKFETSAVKTAFGEHAGKVAISSTKSMTGHLLGAAGGIEFVLLAMAHGAGRIPATINYENPDPECDLDYVPNEARDATVKYAMSNNFGLGGQNASVILGRV